MKFNLRMVATLLIISLLLTSCSGDKESEETLSFGSYLIHTFSVSDYEIDFQPEKLGPYTIEVSSQTKTIHVTMDYDTEVDLLFEQISLNNVVTRPLEEKEFSVELSEGSNFIRLSLSGQSYDVDTVYTFEFIKPSSSASLNAYAVFNFNNSIESAVTITPSFDSDVLEYSATVDYNTCAYAFVISTEYKESSTTLDGEFIESDVLHYQNLAPGINDRNVFVTSEDGESTRRYSMTIAREEGSEEETRGDSNLMSLEIEEANIEFICGINTYLAIVDSEIDSLSLNLKTAVAGARIFWDNKEILQDETLRIPIEQDEGVITLSVESVDQSSVQNYSIKYQRRSTNLVEVDTVEELIAALENARPNDEIRIAEGEYDISTSSIERPSFFSSQSGTINEPIYLVPELSDAEVILTNSADSETVFQLQGNHWFVSNIIFEGSENGLILSRADSNEFRSIVIQDSKERGLWIQGGCDDNRFVFSEIHDIGVEDTPGESAITIGEDIMTWDETYEAPTQNQIRHNDIYLLATRTAIQIEEGTSDSSIEYNTFTETRDKYTTKHDHILQIQGDKTRVSYNYIQHALLHPLDSAIIFFQPDLHVGTSNTVSEAWVYQNKLIVSGPETPFLVADGSYLIHQVDNQAEGSDLIIDGSGISSEDFSTPQYRIKLAGDERKCLSLEQLTDEDDRYYMIVTECAEEEAEIWSFEVGDGAHVNIKNKAHPTEVLSTFSGFQDACDAISNASSNIFLEEDVLSFTQRWAIDYHDDDVIIRSKRLLSYGLTVGGTDLNDGNAVVACPYAGESRQKFQLQFVSQD